MPSLVANVANGTCPENCKCAVLFMDAIVQRTLKFVAFNGKDEPDISGKDEMEGVIPPTRVLWRKAAEIYWEEKSEQLLSKKYPTNKALTTWVLVPNCKTLFKNSKKRILVPLSLSGDPHCSYVSISHRPR